MPYLFWILSFGASFFALSQGNGLDHDTISKCVEQALIPSAATDCYYPTITSSQAIRQLRDKWIVFMGESTLRQLFLQFLGIIKSEPFDHIPDQKGQRKMEERLAGSRYTFLYYEYYQNISDSLTTGPPKLYDGRYPDLLILNDGLHDLLYDQEHMDASWDTLAAIILEFTQKYHVPLMWIPSPQIHDDHLTKHRKDSSWFNNDTVHKRMILKQYALYQEDHGYQYYYDVFRNITYNTWNFDGIHNMERARMEAEGLVRTFYYVNRDPCGWEHDELSAGQIMTFIFYLVIVSIVFVAQSLKLLFYRLKPKGDLKSSNIELQGLLANDESLELTKAKDSGECDPELGDDGAKSSLSKPALISSTKTAAVERKSNGHPEKGDVYEFVLPGYLNFAFIKLMLKHYVANQQVYIAFWKLALCLGLLFLFDGPTHWFISPSLKRYNRDFFIFLHLVFLLISYLTFQKNPAKDCDKILSRLQTEEWKGIMQIVFVMYHYFDAAEIYNMIRVFIGAYVWMTGYGNTLFFVKRNIFNLNRLFGMLFRLNWLVFWVCLLLNQSFMLYYICPLHTFFFLFCYCTWGIAYHLNDKPWVKEIKLAVSGLLLCVMFETDVSIFNFVWNPLWFLLNFHGTLYEWHFRTTLDHYATWMGMVFAVYYDPICKCLTVDLKGKKRVKAVICAGCLVMMFLWYEYVYRHDKFTYNAMHPYTESIPIFCYIILRNVHDGWRGYYSVFLAWMGQITLESYIFQYHLYMVNDAKSILTVIPNYPLCNFMIVSVFYVWMSRIAFNTTNTLRNALYPPRSKDTNWVVCKRTFSYLMIVAVLYVISRFVLFTVQ
eukprot:1143570_1